MTNPKCLLQASKYVEGLIALSLPLPFCSVTLQIIGQRGQGKHNRPSRNVREVFADISYTWEKTCHHSYLDSHVSPNVGNLGPHSASYTTYTVLIFLYTVLGPSTCWTAMCVRVLVHQSSMRCARHTTEGRPRHHLDMGHLVYTFSIWKAAKRGTC